MMSINSVRLLIITLGVASIHAAAGPDMQALRNGTMVPTTRIAAVSNALTQLAAEENQRLHGDRFWLWRTSLKAIQSGYNPCDLNTLAYEQEQLQRFTPEKIAQFNTLSITQEGMLDEHTQHIIVCSFRGTYDGKIFNKQDPVAAWYESVPGYTTYRIIFHGL